MRYVGSLVADFHRNLLGGGVFCYPANSRRIRRASCACSTRRTRSRSSCEQAGGAATDGKTRILDVQPTELHQRTPLFIGTKSDVDAARCRRSRTRLRARRRLAGSAHQPTERLHSVRHPRRAGLPARRRAHRLRPGSGRSRRRSRTRAASSPTMYRGRLWTMRQYAGFGTARRDERALPPPARRRARRVSPSRSTCPTQMGIDSDSPRALGEVGRVGVAIDTVEDMHVLLDGIPLDRVSTSMTINATAAIAAGDVHRRRRGARHRARDS